MDSLQPVDLLVALKLAALGDANTPLRDLEEQLGVPKSSVGLSVKRLGAFHIIRTAGSGKRINRLAFWDLIEHGVRWIAPAEIGDFGLGLLTAHSAEPLASQLMDDGDVYVIPLSGGPARGRAVSPIHPMAPKAASRDPRLCQLLVLADAFRVGRAREKKIASEEIRKWR